MLLIDAVQLFAFRKMPDRDLRTDEAFEEKFANLQLLLNKLGRTVLD